MGIYNFKGNNQDVVAKLQQLLEAFTSLQFNQPPLLSTFPAPFLVNFSPGETKEIIPSSSNPRRIIIKAISGEVQLLLGTTENIAMSAISVKGTHLVDERWQGIVYGYSADGADILVNIEIENTNDNNEDDMPLPLVIEPFMHSSLEQLVLSEIDEAVQVLTGTAGPKMLRALSFNPGEEYSFNVSIDPGIEQFLTPDSNNMSTIVFYGINYLDMAFAVYARIINQLSDGNQSFYDILAQTSSKNYLDGPGSMIAKFYNTRSLGMFAVNTWNGWRVASLDYTASSQTITLLGY